LKSLEPFFYGKIELNRFNNLAIILNKNKNKQNNNSYEKFEIKIQFSFFYIFIKKGIFNFINILEYLLDIKFLSIMIPTKDSIIEAQERIKKYVHKTPLLNSQTLSKMAGT